MSTFLRDHPIDCPGVVYTDSGWPITCLCSPTLSDLQPLPSSSGANEEDEQKPPGKSAKTRRLRLKHTARRRSTRISEQSHGTAEESPEASSVASSSASPSHFFSRETSATSISSSIYSVQPQEEPSQVYDPAPLEELYTGPCIWPGVYPGLPPSRDYLQDAQPDFIPPTQEPSLFPELETSFDPSEEELSALVAEWTDPVSQSDAEQALMVSSYSSLPVSGDHELELEPPAESSQMPAWEAHQSSVGELPFTITTQEGDVWDNGFY